MLIAALLTACSPPTNEVMSEALPGDPVALAEEGAQAHYRVSVRYALPEGGLDSRVTLSISGTPTINGALDLLAGDGVIAQSIEVYHGTDAAPDFSAAVDVPLTCEAEVFTGDIQLSFEQLGSDAVSMDWDVLAHGVTMVETAGDMDADSSITLSLVTLDALE